MSAAEGGWDGNRRRGGAGGSGSGGGCSGDGPGAAPAGGLLNRFVQLPARPHLAGSKKKIRLVLIRRFPRSRPILKVRKRSFRAGHRAPPARSGHRCVADNANLYVFGGYNPDYDESGGPENEDYPLFRELWRYNFATGAWHQMGTEGYMPRELASMSLVLHGNNLLVFGGTGIPFGESNGNDVHVCNVKYKRWALLSCRGKKPNRIYGQIHAYNLETNTWEEIATRPHEKIGFPAARRCHSCVQIKNDVFVCGGYNGEVILGDIWKLNLQTFQWVKLPAVMPEPVYFHCAAVTPAGCMYVHGGVVNIHENKRTGSLFKMWLVVPSLLELSWEKLLGFFPHLATLSRSQLLHLGLTQGLIERLK
ncbi:kelch domain-containing protein 10 isoform X4 [Lepidochelys kempii]|uniref:kelch domain-containing protein 10 isoform X4 n=1 Tax=Lepidochelys kempii TaxID=8472 RepID=UPI0020960895|nr:kelch domain-containing protein 10 isoform X5 [Caretta caretta]